MQKAEESDCSVSDREAENFMKKRALTKAATRKISTTDLKDLKKGKIKLKKDKKQKALEDEMHSKQLNLMAPFMEEPNTKTLDEEIQEEIFVKLL